MLNMKKNVYLNIIALGIAGLSLCGFQTAPKMSFVSSAYSGHEEITRQALNNILKKFSDLGFLELFNSEDFTTDLDPAPKGLFGYSSKNMLIHGNFATDFPKQTTVMDLSKFWKNPYFDQYENADNQVAHFLRNYTGTYTLASAKATCIRARENIKFATSEAIKLWQAGDKTKSLFLLGHVTHTIQDSFSAAHSVRDNVEKNNNLKDICFYGNQMAKSIDIQLQKKSKLCLHGQLDSRDVIWNQKEEQVALTKANWPDEKSIQCSKGSDYPTTDDEKIGCLKHEARLARLATEKYLYLVFFHLTDLANQKIQQRPAEEFIHSLDKRLFDGPVGDEKLDQKMANGIMRCEDLSDESITGRPVDTGN